MELDRRAKDRRVDPNAWSPEHLKGVKIVFALAGAGFFMIAGTVLIFWAVTNEAITNMVAGLGVGMIAIGFLAAFPSRTMPIISVVLKRFGFNKIDLQDMSTATLDAIDLVEDSKDET